MTRFYLLFLFFSFLSFLVYGMLSLVSFLKKRRRRERVAAIVSPGKKVSRGFLRDEPREKRGFARKLNLLVDLSIFEILLADSRVPLSLESFFILSLCLATVSAVCLYSVIQLMSVAFVMFVLGLIIPLLYLRNRKKDWDRHLVEQLPEALDLITRSLRVGQSVDQALKEVAEALALPLGHEIRAIHDKMAMGISFEEALRHFESRYPALFDVTMFCSAFIIQRETGGNLVRILRELAKTIRNRFYLERQIRAMTAEGRLSAIVLGCLPLVFALISSITKPGYLDIFLEHPTGQWLLALALLLEITGFGVMRLLVRVKV